MNFDTLLNSLLGTYYCNNQYYIETYDIYNNSLKKEFIDNLPSLKDNSTTTTFINENKNIKYDAFCINCRKNIILNENLNCKTHNIKYFKDIIIDIDINSLESNLKKIIDNYERILKIIEEKIYNFKKRNNAQIVLAKKLIENYKIHINNLNYQIILNTKNILKFNEIQLKSFLEYNTLFDYDFNILKDFSIYNYINDELKIENIQMNTEILYNSSHEIENVIILEKRKKLIFNIKNNIYMVNMEKFIQEDEIESNLSIKLINLMKDKETILISCSSSIKKLRIENNKLILENFLENIIINSPGVIINYENEYAWTSRTHIGFSKREFFDINENLSEENISNSFGYKIKLYNLFEFKNDILFILLFVGFDHHYERDGSIRLGSYKKSVCKDQFFTLEEHESISTNDFKLYEYKSNNVIIFGKIAVHIIDVLNWELIKKIYISEKLIKNSFYLKEFSLYLIFFSKSTGKDIDEFYNDINVNYLLSKKDEDFDMMLMRIRDDCNNITLKMRSNLSISGIYYNEIISDNELNLNLINVVKDTIKFYKFINIKKSIEMKNN